MRGDLARLKYALVESICLECEITPIHLEAMLGEPGFGAHGRPHDWRDHVPPEIIEAWPCLSPDAMIVAFYMAHTQFLRGQSGG